MDIQFILYLILLLLNILLQLYLYYHTEINKDAKDNINVYYLNMISISAFSAFVWTVYPDPYYSFEKTIAIIVALCSLGAVLLRYKNEKYIMVSKVILTISLLVNLGLLYF